MVATAAAPSPAMPAVTGAMALDTFPAPAEILLAVVPILARATLLFFAWSSSFLSCCSVAMISRWRASYCCWETSPFWNCSWTCFSAFFSASSLVLVSWTASPRSRWRCSSSSTFPGSIFSSRSTSLSCFWVLLISLLTPERALLRPWVSPPISMVIPLMRSANLSTSPEKVFQGARLPDDGIFLPVVCLLNEHIVDHHLLPHRLFIRCFLPFPASSAYLFTPIGCTLSWAGYPFWIPAYALRLAAIPARLHL